MRSWNNKLFLGPLPGRHAALNTWLREIARHEIETIVSLTEEWETRARAPDYYAWRQNQTEYELVSIPIPDGEPPPPVRQSEFWSAAQRVAERARTGSRVYIHCAAGIGRTGMFASAVLMCMGYGFDEALEEIRAAGSVPEARRQAAFIRSGLPESGGDDARS